jgi:DNA-binding NtrC family response regulator
MTVRQRVLIVDDDPNVVAGLEALLADEWDVKTAMTAKDGRAVFADFSPDVVLLDMGLPDGNGVDVLHDLKMYSEAVSVIMMSGVGTIDSVLESMKLGAVTFLQKPFDYSLLSLTLDQVSRIVATRRELIALRRGDSNDQERLPGLSPAVQNLNQLLTQIARAPSPVLIEGDSGTGKGVFARLIHNRSPRSRAPFVDLNCAGLSKELLESELFGHERGAFTNAMNTKQGLFEIASDGTLFLDEIGEMDVTVQARLLKAIEEKRFRRVGGVRDLTTNFRLIAATNKDLGQEVAAGRFRGDLFFRLNVIRVRMPPLRERLEDLPLLVDVILRPLAKEMGRPAPPVSPRALKRLGSYAWPGNVRELRNVLERAMLTMTGKEISSDDLLLESSAGSIPVKAGGLPSADWEIRPLDDVVADYVTASVTAAEGNVRKAARLLQISPSTLYARMKK